MSLTVLLGAGPLAMITNPPLAWPNGADLDPDVLYGRLTGMPIFLEQDTGLAH